MGRLVPVLYLVALAALPAAAAERSCDDGVCVTLAWPDRSVDIRTPAAIETLAARGELLPDEAEAALVLVERRLSLRIRGLELRYLIGKTATSGSDQGALDAIRYQVDAIDQEIAFIDRELGMALDAYSRRAGPWLLMQDMEGSAQVWFVAATPCSALTDVAIAANGGGTWIDVVATADPAMPIEDRPGVCVPLRLQIEGGAGVVRLRVDGTVWDFALGE